MTAAEVTAYYADLLILQYKRLPKARGTVAAYCRQLVCDLLPLALRDAFDIDTAAGSQLDILGKYVGVSRDYKVPSVNKNYFGYSDYDQSDIQNPNGFRDYTDSETNKDGIWYKYGNKNYTSGSLTDSQMRVLIRLKIANNHGDGTLYSIINTLVTVFGDAIDVSDGLDMTLTYIVDPETIPAPLEVLSYYLPRPAGVGIGITTEANVFRFSRYDGVPTTRKGFRRYDGQPTGATMVTYP